MVSGMALVYDHRIGQEVPMPSRGQNGLQVTRRESVEKLNFRCAVVASDSEVSIIEWSH